MPGWTHLSDLLTHDGEHPEIQHILRDGRTGGWGRLEVHQQHIGKQQEEEEIHQDVAQKWGHGCKPELAPSWHYKRTLWRSLWHPCGGEGRYCYYYDSCTARFPLNTIFFPEESPLMDPCLGECGWCVSASLVKHKTRYQCINTPLESTQHQRLWSFTCAWCLRRKRQ